MAFKAADVYAMVIGSLTDDPTRHRPGYGIVGRSLQHAKQVPEGAGKGEQA